MVYLQFATGLILAAAAPVASGSAAQAGEGGAAGSVSIKFTNNTDVARLSTSVAVGKSYAAATAFTGSTDTLTSAVGAGGSFVLDKANLAIATFTSDVTTDITTSTATTGGDITAVAVGSAGTVSTVDFNSASVKYTGAADATLGTAQKNDFDGANKSKTNLTPATAGVSLN
jgi:hypothetical protein